MDWECYKNISCISAIPVLFVIIHFFLRIFTICRLCWLVMVKIFCLFKKIPLFHFVYYLHLFALFCCYSIAAVFCFFFFFSRRYNPWWVLAALRFHSTIFYLYTSLSSFSLSTSLNLLLLGQAILLLVFLLVLMNMVPIQLIFWQWFFLFIYFICFFSLFFVMFLICCPLLLNAFHSCCILVFSGLSKLFIPPFILWRLFL